MFKLLILLFSNGFVILLVIEMRSNSDKDIGRDVFDSFVMRGRNEIESLSSNSESPVLAMSSSSWKL